MDINLTLQQIPRPSHRSNITSLETFTIFVFFLSSVIYIRNTILMDAKMHQLQNRRIYQGAMIAVALIIGSATHATAAETFLTLIPLCLNIGMTLLLLRACCTRYVDCEQIG